MIRSRKSFIALCLCLFCLAVSLPAEENDQLQFSLFLDGAEAKIFDERNLLVEDAESLETIREGWTIQTLDESIEMTLSYGAVRIGPDSIIAIDAVNEEGIEVYIVRGELHALSDSFTPITLKTKKNSYQFREGSYLLRVGTREEFLINEGEAEVQSTISEESYTISKEDELETLDSTSSILEANEGQKNELTEELPILHYSRPERIIAAAEPAEEIPVEIIEPQVIEPEEIIAIEPVEDPIVEPLAEPEIVEIVAEEVPVVDDDTKTPDAIELILDDQIISDQVESGDSGRFIGDLRVGLGFMHQLDPPAADAPYITTALYPSVSWGSLDFGARLFIAFQDNPLKSSNWYRQRDNLLWDFGGGAAYSFDLIEDIVSDSFSLVDHLYIGREASAFYLAIDDHQELSIGHGSVLGNLQTSIDDPYIRRVGFYQTTDTPYYQHELLIDDITMARLYGASFGLTPVPDIYPVRIGVSAVADIEVEPTEIIMIPSLELDLPITDELSFYTGLSALMILSDEDGFVYDASYANGLQDFMISGGIESVHDTFSYGLSGYYGKAPISFFNIFGEDYAWRRENVLELLDTYDTAAAQSDFMGLYAHGALDLEHFDGSISYLLPFTSSFVPDLEEDRLSIALETTSGPVSAELGFSSDGLYTALTESTFDLFSTSNRLFAGFGYTLGDMEIKARYAQSALYTLNSTTGIYEVSDNTPTPTLSMETTIRVGDTDDLKYTEKEDDSDEDDQEEMAAEDAETGFSLSVLAGAIDAFDADKSPMSSLYLYPAFTSEQFSLGLRIGIDTAGNPWNIASWLTEDGNNPYDFVNAFQEGGFYGWREFSLDLLSFIDSMEAFSEQDPFYAQVSRTDALTLGHGTLISDLNVGIDDPLVKRTALFSEIDTAAFDTQMLINDLSNPQLFAARFALRPMGEANAFEIGLSQVYDITFESSSLNDAGTSSTKMLWVTSLDTAIPLTQDENHRTQLFAEAAALLVMDDGLQIDSLYSDGSLRNMLFDAGFEGLFKDFEIKASLGYAQGNLTRNLFGSDYSWRRADIYSLFTDGDDDDALADYLSGSTEGGWELYTDFAYDYEDLSFGLFMSLEFDSSFNMRVDEKLDMIGASFAYDAHPWIISAGATRRGFTYDIRPENSGNVNFLDGMLQFYTDITYTLDIIELYGRLSTAGIYEWDTDTEVYTDASDTPTDEFVPVLSLGTTLHLL